jgi:hypothetical protein
MVPHVAFSGVLVIPKDLHWWLTWTYHIIFLKYTNDDAVRAVLENREKLECDQMYCHFQNTKTFLAMVDLPKEPQNSFLGIPLILLTLHLIAYYNINKRMKNSRQ